MSAVADLAIRFGTLHDNVGEPIVNGYLRISGLKH